jgi:REP element-mobilizing transposase RayT
MGRSRYKIFDNDHPHFLTCTVVGWLTLFTDPEIVEILLDSLRFLQKEDRLPIYAYVIMENHLHLIASSDNLSKEIGDFKSFTARAIIEYLEARKFDHLLHRLMHGKLDHKEGRTYQVWQEGSHPELIQGAEMMRQKIEYIHYNPVRRGYIDLPTDWRYSSSRNYEGKEGLLKVITDWI